MVEYKAESQLISLLENEAQADLSSLDLPSLNEAEIKLQHVRTWYFETEKLIRVLGNILPSSMAQPINQLRYAGHHILKAQIGDECGTCELPDPSKGEAKSKLIFKELVQSMLTRSASPSTNPEYLTMDVNDFEVSKEKMSQVKAINDSANRVYESYVDLVQLCKKELYL